MLSILALGLARSSDASILSEENKERDESWGIHRDEGSHGESECTAPGSSTGKARLCHCVEWCKPIDNSTP